MNTLLSDRPLSKVTNIQDAISSVRNGSTIMVGGFGSPGTPFTLIDFLLKQGSTDLTLIKNDANEIDIGIDRLIEAGRVTKLIATHLGLNRNVLAKMNNNELQVEFVPQGILAERIRCAGAGIPGFLSSIGLNTEVARPENFITFQNQTYQVEPALKADFALIHAAHADEYGNLAYRATAQNFNPLMAMAADCVIVETVNVSKKPLQPEHIHTPGIFVNHIVKLETLGKNYQLMEHHILQK